MVTLPTVRHVTVDPWPFERNRIEAGWQVGDLVFTSGQVSVGPEQEVVGAGDFDAQAAQVFANLERILRAGGSRLDNIVKVTIYLTDMAYLPKIVELRGTYFTPPYPASTMVEVSALALPELLIEIEAVAVTDRSLGRTD